jgi:hypothetical protein
VGCRKVFQCSLLSGGLRDSAIAGSAESLRHTGYLLLTPPGVAGSFLLWTRMDFLLCRTMPKAREAETREGRGRCGGR